MSRNLASSFSRHDWDNLVRRVRSKTGCLQAAEDIAQDTVIAGLERGNLSEEYIAGISRNKIYAYFREKGRAISHIEVLDEGRFASTTDSKAYIDAELKESRLYAEIRLLSQESQNLIHQVLAGDQNKKQIAATLSISHEALRQRWSRALRTLRSAMKNMAVLLLLATSLVALHMRSVRPDGASSVAINSTRGNAAEPCGVTDQEVSNLAWVFLASKSWLSELSTGLVHLRSMRSVKPDGASLVAIKSSAEPCESTDQEVSDPAGVLLTYRAWLHPGADVMAASKIVYLSHATRQADESMFSGSIPHRSGEKLRLSAGSFEPRYANRFITWDSSLRQKFSVMLGISKPSVNAVQQGKMTNREVILFPVSCQFESSEHD